MACFNSHQGVFLKLYMLGVFAVNIFYAAFKKRIQVVVTWYWKTAVPLVMSFVGSIAVVQDFNLQGYNYVYSRLVPIFRGGTKGVLLENRIEHFPSSAHTVALIFHSCVAHLFILFLQPCIILPLYHLRGPDDNAVPDICAQLAMNLLLMSIGISM